MSPTQRIVSSAPGKVILHGEYAVVFGKNAVAVSVDLRTTVTLDVLPSPAATVTLNLESFAAIHKWPLEVLKSLCLTSTGSSKLSDDVLQEISSLIPSDLQPEVENAYKAFIFLYLGICHKQKSDLIPMDITVSSEFPVGAGLGSSAAFSVALTGALLSAFTDGHPKDVDLDLVRDWAFESEKLFHGRPSGIDNSICTLGGAILFKEGKIMERVAISSVLPIVLVYTNVRRNTKTLVESASRRREKFPDVISNTMGAIDAISLKSWQLLKDGSYTQDDRSILVEMNQHLLNVLGAGHESIDQVVKIAKSYGHSAKLTGAGGGGCVIIHLTPGISSEETGKLESELDRNYFKSWNLSVGGSGLTLSTLGTPSRT